MGKVRTGRATSLDGFIAGPNDGPEASMGEGGERLCLGISAATPDIDCLARRWCSKSRRKPLSTFERRVQRQGLW